MPLKKKLSNGLNQLTSNKLSDNSDGSVRSNIEIGCYVEIVQKHHQRSGELTDGHVERILTKSQNHTHGIKVKLETGEVGRVKK
ncbi:MAG: YwbE family protein [Flavobacteriales bacterium]|nr:YwbE family protein [Flavobacteriales bacterium]